MLEHYHEHRTLFYPKYKPRKVSSDKNTWKNYFIKTDWNTFFQPIINYLINISNNRNWNLFNFNQLKKGKDWNQSDFLN